jgi:hypothetical protein
MRGDTVVAVNEMMFQLLLDAVDDIRHFHSSQTVYQNGKINHDALRSHLPAWERGRLVNSAAYITSEMVIDGKWSVPRGAVQVSRQILEAEAAYLDELQAASVAGVPWKGTFPERLETCTRCGEKASWRFALNIPQGMPAESAWRLSRPENAAPLCHRCEAVVKFKQREEVRFDLAWGLWGPRFEALHRWYLAAQHGRLPEAWFQEDHPLWPPEYGGRSWKEGSGTYIHCLPRPPLGVTRSGAHFSALNRALGMATKRHGKIGPYFSALKLIHSTPNPGGAGGRCYADRDCVYRGAGTCNYCDRDWNRGPARQEEGS